MSWLGSEGVRRSKPRHRGPADFVRVSATRQEIEKWNESVDPHLRSNSGPGVYRVRCVYCGKRIWGSGLGIGSHRRACPREWPPMLDKDKVIHCRQCGSTHVEIDAFNLDGTDTLICFDCGVKDRVPRNLLWPDLYKEA